MNVVSGNANVSVFRGRPHSSKGPVPILLFILGCGQNGHFLRYQAEIWNVASWWPLCQDRGVKSPRGSKIFFTFLLRGVRFFFIFRRGIGASESNKIRCNIACRIFWYPDSLHMDICYPHIWSLDVWSPYIWSPRHFWRDMSPSWFLIDVYVMFGYHMLAMSWYYHVIP